MGQTSQSPRTAHTDTPNVRQQQDDKKYTPSSQIIKPTVTSESDEELLAEKPRRTPRSVLRPDYAELVANKDPWSLSDGDSEVSLIHKPYLCITT